jgi:hypothetical protein
MTVHTVCLDYKLRASNLQLSDFARMSAKDKALMVESGKKAKKESVSLFSSVCKSLELKVGGELEIL